MATPPTSQTPSTRCSTEATLVGAATLLMDAGLGVLLLALAALMVWRLVDLFGSRGRWREEWAEAREVAQ